MRRLIALILAALLLTTVMGPAALAETGYDREPLNFTYTKMNFKYEAEDSLIGQAWLAAMEEKLGREINIDYNLINWAEYPEKITLLVNTGSLTDLVTIKGIQDTKTKEYGDMGMFVDMAKYSMPNVEGMLEKMGDAKNSHFTAGGARYWVPYFTYQMYGTATMEWGSSIAEDVLSENNLEIPISVDDLFETALKLKEIYPDSYPIGAADGNFTKTGYSMLQTTFHTNINIFFTTDSMRYEYGPVTENYRTYLQYMHKLYENELIPPDYSAWTADMCQAAVANNQCFILFGCVGNIFNENPAWTGGHDWTILTASLNDPEIGTPWGITKGNGPVSDYSANTWAYLVMDAKAQNIDDLIEFVDANYAPEIQTIYQWGVLDETYYIQEDGSFMMFEQYANAAGATIEENPRIEAGFADQNQRTPGIFPYVQVGGLRQIVWPEYKIMQMDGTYVMANQKQYSLDNVNAKNSNNVGQVLPSLTSEQVEAYSNMMTAVITYAEESRAKFINGEMDIEADWDAYLENIYKLGDIDAAVKIYNDTIEGMELYYE